MTGQKKPPFPRKISGDDVEQILSEKVSEEGLKKLAQGQGDAREKIGWAKTKHAENPGDPAYVVAETSAETTWERIDAELPSYRKSVEQSQKSRGPRNRPPSLKQRGFDLIVALWPDVSADSLMNRLQAQELVCDHEDLEIRAIGDSGIEIRDLSKRLPGSTDDYESVFVKKTAIREALKRARDRATNN